MTGSVWFSYIAAKSAALAFANEETSVRTERGKLATWIQAPPMIGITALCMFDSSSEQWFIGIFLLRIAAAFVLGRSGYYRFFIPNCMPVSFTSLFHKNLRHSLSPSFFENCAECHNASWKRDLQENMATLRATRGRRAVQLRDSNRGCV
jgi:hypothetical protein